MSGEKPDSQPRSHVFMVRVWEEAIGPQQSEWRGRVQLLTTGETRYFREWTGLAPLLVTLLADLDTDWDSKL